MAKFLLKAGAEVDFLTADELAAQNDDMRSFFREIMRETEGSTFSRSAGPFLTDASGNTAYLANGGGSVYTVPVGYDAFLTRISIDYEGSNAKSPQSCDLRVVADQNTPASLRLIFNSVPAVWDGSRSHAPIFRGGQRVVVCLQGGPASTSIYCTVQVLLIKTKPTPSDALLSV